MRSMNNDHDEDDDLLSPMPMEDIKKIQRFTEQGLSRCDVVLRSESSTEFEKERARKEMKLYLEDIESIKIERTERGSAELSICGVNFWTTLAITSGDYLRRFRWKSGLGVALALYLIVTVVFVWTSLEDAEEPYDEGIGSMISRQLLSAAAGALVVESWLIIETGPNPSNIVVFIDPTNPDLPLVSRPDIFSGYDKKMDCNWMIRQAMANTNLQLAPGGRTASISETYWRDANSGQLIQICKFDADLIIDHNHCRLVPSSAAQTGTGWSDKAQRVLNAVVVGAPLPPQVSALQPMTITYLVIRKNGNFLLTRTSTGAPDWEIPYKAQQGTSRSCKKRFNAFMREQAGNGLIYADPNTKNAANIQGSTWMDGQQTYQMCFVDADIHWGYRRNGLYKAVTTQEAQSSVSLSISDQNVLQSADRQFGDRRPSPNSRTSSQQQSGSTAERPQDPTGDSSLNAPHAPIPSVPVPPEENQNEWDTRTIVMLTVAAIGIFTILCCAFIVIIGILSKSQSAATEAVEEKPEEPQKVKAAEQAEDLDQAEEKRDEVRTIEDMV